MKERLSINSKIIELNEIENNDIYMTLKMCVLTNQTNLNMARFTDEFINEIVENKEDYIGIPLVANREMLENKEFDGLTHELDPVTGELRTDIVGSFIDFYTEQDDDGTLKLMAEVRVFKRFPNVCSSIVELFQAGDLEFSCECLVYEYANIEDDGTRVIDAGGGKLFASAIVSEPAEVRSKATLLIAEAYKKDIESYQQGGVKMDKKADYNNGVKVQYIGQLETSSLKFWEIEKAIYNLVNPVDPENGDREYNYWIHTLYHDKVILGHFDKDVLYSVNYKIENDTVILDSKENWVKGSFQFVPDGVDIDKLLEQNDERIKDLEEELDSLKEEKLQMSQDNKKKIEELNQKIEELESEIADLKEKNQQLEETIVSQKEEIVKAEETINELNEQVEELGKYKEQVEKAEKEAKMAELSEKYSKLLPEEIFSSDEVKQAIENLDEAKLNSIVVAEIAKEKEEDKNPVEIAATKHVDLVETVKDSSYWSAPVSK